MLQQEPVISTQHVAQMEAARALANKHIKKARLITAAIIAGSVLMIFILPPPYGTATFAFTLTFGIIASVYIFKHAFKYRSQYIYDYRQTVIKWLIERNDTTLLYEPDNWISSQMFVDSHLFHSTPNVYHGDNYISRQQGNIHTQLSYIHAQKRTRSGKSTSIKTIFKGWFFIFTVEREVNGQIVITRDITQGILGVLGHIQETFTFGSYTRVKMPDEVFEKKFQVHAQHPDDVPAVITPLLMRTMSEWAEQYQMSVQISFKSNRIYVSVASPGTSFTPPLKTAVDDRDMLTRHVQEVNFLLDMVNRITAAIEKNN